MAFEWFASDDTTAAGTANDLSTSAGTASAAVELHAWLNKGSSVGDPETRYLRVYVEDPASAGTYKTSGLDILDRREIEIRIIGSQNPDLVAGFVVSTTAWKAVGTERVFQLPAIYPNCCIEIEARVNPGYEGGASSPATFRIEAILGTGADGANLATEASVLALPAKMPARLVALAPVTWPSSTANGDFTTVLAPWDGTNWAQSAGTALHTAGSDAKLFQQIPLVEGVTYRITVTVSGTTGTVSPYIDPTTATAIAAGAGTVTREIVASASGNLWVEFTPSTDFDGALDDILVEALYYGLPDDIGGETVADGDTLLLTAETDATRDGKWTAVDGGVWTRSDDAATVTTLYAGAQVYVQEGTGNRTVYIQTAPLTDLSTDPQTWEVLIAL